MATWSDTKHHAQYLSDFMLIVWGQHCLTPMLNVFSKLIVCPMICMVRATWSWEHWLHLAWWKEFCLPRPPVLSERAALLLAEDPLLSKKLLHPLWAKAGQELCALPSANIQHQMPYLKSKLQHRILGISRKSELEAQALVHHTSASDLPFLGGNFLYSSASASTRLKCLSNARNLHGSQNMNSSPCTLLCSFFYHLFDLSSPSNELPGVNDGDLHTCTYTSSAKSHHITRILGGTRKHNCLHIAPWVFEVRLFI